MSIERPPQGEDPIQDSCAIPDGLALSRRAVQLKSVHQIANVVAFARPDCPVRFDELDEHIQEEGCVLEG